MSEASMSKDHGPQSLGGRRATPRPSSRTSAKPRAMAARVSGAISWKVRYTVESEATCPNRSVLGPQVLDVGTALAATGQHQRGCGRGPCPGRATGPVRPEWGCSPRGDHRAQPVGEITQCMEPDVGDDLVAPGFHNDGKVLVVSIS